MEILFEEKQRFSQWWLWLILIGINGVFLFGAYKQIIQNDAFGNKPMSNEGLLFTLAIVMLVTLLFLSLRLETVIKNDGIYVRFFPVHIKFKFYAWGGLKKCYIRTYAPILEYGGWGLRVGLFGKGKAFNVSGNKGLQLEFQDGSKLLIGTNKPDALQAALQRIGQVKEE